MFKIATLNIIDAGRAFYNATSELHDPTITWDAFIAAFCARFRYVHTDQFHFFQLQTARHAMNRRRNLLIDAAGWHKNIRQVDDPAMQKLYQEQAGKILLASFTSGILGNPDRQVRNTFPSSMNEAFRRAVAVSQADLQERRNEAFILHSESRKHNSADRPNPGERGRDQSKCSTQHKGPDPPRNKVTEVFQEERWKEIKAHARNAEVCVTSCETIPHAQKTENLPS
jgi:hypothetical protein